MQYTAPILTPENVMGEDPLSFEEAIRRLEEISDLLDRGKASLDESLKLYEEGIRLVRYCTAKLDAAEAKIRTIDPKSVSASGDDPVQA